MIEKTERQSNTTHRCYLGAFYAVPGAVDAAQWDVGAALLCILAGGGRGGGSTSKAHSERPFFASL